MIKLLFVSAIVSNFALCNVFYSSISNQRGFKLKTSLKKIISSSHRPRSYDDLYNIYFISDLDTTYENDGTIMDIYSENPRSHDPYTYSKKGERCGNYKVESDCFNREHLVPQSIYKSRSPMVADFFHVFPTDGKVNGMRSNFPFGEVNSPRKTSQNGSKLGRNSTPGYNGVVFEPIDEFKGDVARAMLYFATRYEDRVSEWSHDMFDGSSDKVYKPWFLKLLLKWHKNDPVSKHEIKRNNAGQTHQGNRNPFIDHPEYAELIWN